METLRPRWSIKAITYELAYCLYITLQRRPHALAPGLTARSALEKFAAIQMIHVHIPTTRPVKSRNYNRQAPWTETPMDCSAGMSRACRTRFTAGVAVSLTLTARS